MYILPARRSIKSIRAMKHIMLMTIRRSKRSRSLCAVKFILEGDEKALNSSVISEKKAATQAKTEIVTPTGLTGEFTFENFVVGDCNRFAHASAVSVATKPGQKQRNPFFLWGNSTPSDKIIISSELSSLDNFLCYRSIN